MLQSSRTFLVTLIVTPIYIISEKASDFILASAKSQRILPVYEINEGRKKKEDRSCIPINKLRGFEMAKILIFPSIN
ncbi:hypothetical protein WA1_35140 [Scytonema hofmannii PCC 7110]|uniref:Uncharacterized protein n=1 Tax=Scytonema hofmannii PCC 7110 TaxID=128403 RepID=A0A139X2A5_9CYAN|nr:hypothetical protein WA1_35140 [Scytonema hofmannii PCC 7110]